MKSFYLTISIFFSIFLSSCSILDVPVKAYDVAKEFVFPSGEKLRWDKGFSLTKAEATANFFSVLSSGRPHKIKTGSRPGDLARRRQYPYYKPRMGSSAGKIRTKQIGAKRVQKDFENLMKQIFMIGEGLRGKGQKKAKMPKVNVTKYISSD